jgi:hypothetical protein
MGVIVPNPTVTEVDGNPSITNVKKIVVSNGTLNASGRTATIETGGGGGGGTVTSVSASSPLFSTGGSDPVLSLIDDGVVRAKIGPAAVGTTELGVNSVTGAKIASQAITQAKMANDSVGQSQIIGGSIVSNRLANDAVITDKILAGAVTPVKLKNNGGTPSSTTFYRGDGQWSTPSSGGGGTVTGVSATAPLASTGGSAPAISLNSGGITADKIATNAVTTAKISSQAITQAKMANDSVGQSQIIGGSIVSNRLANGAVITDKIASQAITQAKMANDSVGQSQIIGGSIVSNRLANGAVITDKILSGAVTPVKLKNNGGTASSSTFYRGDGQWAEPSGGGGGGVTAVTGTSPIASSGGTTPAISLANNGVTIAKLVNNGGTPSSTTFLRGDGQWITPSGGGSANQNLFPQSDKEGISGAPQGVPWRGSSNIWVMPNAHGSHRTFYGGTNAGNIIGPTQINFNTWYTAYDIADLGSVKFEMALQRGTNCTTTTTCMLVIYSNSSENMPSTMVAQIPITPGVAGAGTQVVQLNSATWYNSSGTAITGNIPMSKSTLYWFGITGAYELSNGATVNSGITFRTISGNLNDSDFQAPGSALASKGTWQHYYAGGLYRGNYNMDTTSANTAFRGTPQAWSTTGTSNPKITFDYSGSAPTFLCALGVS